MDMSHFPIFSCVFLITLFCNVLFGSVALAQSQNPQHEKQIKQGLERLQQKTDPFLQRQAIFLQNHYAPTNVGDVSTSSAVCFDIQEITVSGVTVIDPFALNDITHPFIEQCLDLPKINHLISLVSNVYLDKGYVTSRAYIAPQDLNGGHLSLVVVEGEIEGFDIGKAKLSQQQLQLAFPMTKGDKLNLRDIEQGLENINRLFQNQVTTSLAPGNYQGGTVIELSNQMSKPWQASLSFNNTGNDETGKHQLDAFYVHNNLFGLNDNIVASMSSNVGGKKLKHAVSRSYSLNVDMPYHYWQFALGNTFFEYEQTINGASIDFITSGTSFNTNISLENRLFRDQNSTFDVKVAFARKDSKNYLEDVYLDTSSRTLYIWELAGFYKKNIPLGSFDISFVINHSVPWFDAKQKVVEAENDFQFTKYQLDAGLSLFFDLGTQPVRYSLRGHYVHAPKNIILSEGVSVGGRYSVRGISDDSLYGYRGGYVRNDLTFPLAIDSMFLSQLSVSFGLDIGSTNTPYFSEVNNEWAAGSMVSLQGAREHISFSLTYAKALHIPDILQAGDQTFDFKVQINF
jgi:hemolysin activation/secretion protein